MIEIEIVNWEKRQERTNRKNYTWFKFFSGFFTDAKTFNWPPEKKLVFIFLLCERNKTDKTTILVNERLSATCVGISENKFTQYIKELIDDAVIMPVLCRHEAGIMSSLDKTDRQTDRGEETKPEAGLTPSGSKLPPLADLWNSEIREPLARVRTASKQRRRLAQARWAEKPDAEFWTEVIRRINKSRFCRGDNARGWKADFDFFIKPDTASKVLEGKYDDRINSTAIMTTVDPEKVLKEYHHGTGQAFKPQRHVPGNDRTAIDPTAIGDAPRLEEF